MMPFQIVSFVVDEATPEIWAALHAHRRAIAAELYPEEPILSDAESEHEMRRVNPLWETRRWLALSGDRVVGAASAWFRREGSAHAEEHARFMSCHGSVAADARWKGAGTLLLREIHTLMQALDKTMLTLSAFTDEGHAFMTRFGAVAKHSALLSRALFSELDWPTLEHWENGIPDLGLTWERYVGRVPRAVVLALLPTFTELLADVPVGDLEFGPIRSEIEGYDRWYETLDRTGGAHHLILLRDASGAVAAVTESAWDSRTPQDVAQQLTAVARPFRGRGLARALKAAMLRQVRACHPEAKQIRTMNSEGNAAILAINHRIGFSVYRRFVDYQVTRSGLETALSAP